MCYTVQYYISDQNLLDTLTFKINVCWNVVVSQKKRNVGYMQYFLTFDDKA